MPVLCHRPGSSSRLPILLLIPCLALALLTAGCGGCGGQDECTASADCKSNEVCLGNRCRQICERDYDCPAGFACYAGACLGEKERDAGGADKVADDHQVPEDHIITADAPPDIATPDRLPDRSTVDLSPPDLHLEDTAPDVTAATDIGHDADAIDASLESGAGIDAAAQDTGAGVDAGADAGPDPGQPWLQLSRGSKHSCGLRADGTLWCWGDNRDGRLGAPSGDRIVVPAQVGTESDWSQVECGGYYLSPNYDHTCALKQDGSLWCWGDNSYGQLGIESTDLQNSPQPVEPGISTWSQISAGSATTCAVKTDDSLWCWGDNRRGQLGLGDEAGAMETSPQQVIPGSSWSHIASGWGVKVASLFVWSHGCGIRVDGDDRSLWCWGDNSKAQLGIGNTTSYTSPQKVGTATDWATVSAGMSRTCATRLDGQLFCWGDLGNEVIQNVPGRVGGARDWSGVEVGPDLSCAIKTGGQLHCWGDNSFGQLGIGSLEPLSEPGVAVTGIWHSVATGASQACGILQGGQLLCWGSNLDSSLGIGHGSPVLQPEPIAPETGWANLSGNMHTCAVASDGALWCWGDNEHGQLSTGDTHDRAAPAPVGFDLDWSVVSVGTSNTCALKDDRSLWCWGASLAGDEYFPVRIGSDSDWSRISNRGSFACALKSDGTLWCWGSGSSGRLGLGDQNDRAHPTQVGTTTLWTGVACGSGAACATQSNGSLWCWGGNSEGQLGQGDTVQRLIPTRLGAEANWARVSAGSGFFCAIRNASLSGPGSLWCWGNDYYGQASGTPGDDLLSPVQITSGENWLQVTGEEISACAVDTAGAVRCWGGNHSGQLGLGHSDEVQGLQPTIDDPPMRAVSSSVWGHCAITTDDKLWCWGSNQNGQLGNGMAWRILPTLIP